MGKEIFEKNLKAMKKWYPEFVNMLRDEIHIEDDTEVLTEVSWDGELIFKIEKEGRQLYLGGKREAKEPIEMWLQRLGKLHKYTSVFLFGLGHGAYLKALVEHTEKEVNIVAYEPSIHIFQKLLWEVDLSEAIADRPIAFLVEGLNDVEFGPVMNKVLAVQNMEFLKEEIHPNYREFYGEKIVEKIRILNKKVDAIMMGYRTGKLFQKNLVQNIFSNMKYVCEGYHTKKLAETIQPEGAAILVAAGPSLNKNIHELKKAKNKAFLLAVDTAVKPLLKAGIVPDAFITIDPDKPLALIEAEGAEQIPVIAPVTAKYSLLDHQKGKKIFFYDGYHLPQHIYQINGKVLPMVSGGGSVACNGFSLLYKMEFDTIILVGQDLAYTDNKSHADGTFEEKMPEKDTSGMIMVKGNYQEKIPTLHNLKVYLDWFDMYVKGAKEHRGVRVINATAGGAYIEGTELMTLGDAIEETCHGEKDYAGKIACLEPDLTPEEQKKAFAYLGGVAKELAEIKKNAGILKGAYKKLGKLADSGNMTKDGCLKHLRRIRKLAKKCQKSHLYQLLDVTMSSAEYVVLSEYYYEEEDYEKDIQETARKGVIYSEVLKMCAELLKELAEEYLGDKDKDGTEEKYAEQ
ncbi:hypothetical protein C806_01003 [Lachnospiraceae bacterium 3-1]|nr:hypothetical protein C806_01003 [Lachnospiraceae bacterium 3-1]